jgi:hypothetical protein
VVESAFFEVDFLALVLSSLFIPLGIYIFLLRTPSISRSAVSLFGVALITLSCLDVFLLRRLRNLALATPSLLDDKVFASEITVALYLLPVLFGGVGVNLVSHVLIDHLKKAEH